MSNFISVKAPFKKDSITYYRMDVPTLSSFLRTIVTVFFGKTGETGDINAPSGTRTWDLSVCLYLNLIHGDLEHPATMAGLGLSIIFRKNLKSQRENMHTAALRNPLNQ